MPSHIVIIRGGGDLGTGVAYELHRHGYCVAITELAEPLVIRRTVAFAEAIWSEKTMVQGVAAVHIQNLPTREDLAVVWQAGQVAVLVDPHLQILTKWAPDVLIDAIIAKKNTGTAKGMAPVTIALGPGFTAGEEVDAVIETNRGDSLGRIIRQGQAMSDTSVPAPVLGHTRDRVLRAPCPGKIRNFVRIGDLVACGDKICQVAFTTVQAPFAGAIRGLIREGMVVPSGCKIGDIDPRGLPELCHVISDKASAIGRAAWQAICQVQDEKKL